MSNLQYLYNRLDINNDAWSEQLATKHSVIEKTIESLGYIPSNILFAAFNPVIFSLAPFYNISVISDIAIDGLPSNVKVYPSIDHVVTNYECVIALDELVTFYADEDSQKEFLRKISEICRGWFITTLRDYKNISPHRKHSAEAQQFHRSGDQIIVEINNPDRGDKQCWSSQFYMIEDGKLITTSTCNHRTMYFKQLAKYCYDLGSKAYIIQKNILYKSFVKKQFEHVITVRF